MSLFASYIKSLETLFISIVLVSIDIKCAKACALHKFLSQSLFVTISHDVIVNFVLAARVYDGDKMKDQNCILFDVYWGEVSLTLIGFQTKVYGIVVYRSIAQRQR